MLFCNVVMKTQEKTVYQGNIIQVDNGNFNYLLRNLLILRNVMRFCKLELC